MFTLTHLPSLGAQEKTNCTSMLWSIDSYQNRASADQYHLTVSRAQVSTHRGRVFVEVTRWQITSFKWSQAQVYFFQGFLSNMLYLCHYGPALLGFWFQTDLGSCLLYTSPSPRDGLLSRMPSSAWKKWTWACDHLKLVICQRITSTNTRPRWVDTWARDTVRWYWSADALFW